MRRCCVIVILCAWVLGAGWGAGEARGATIYVGPNETHKTIQAGIDAAAAGDVVIVRDGTYTGTGNRDIDFKGKAIHLKSENGAEGCIVDALGNGKCFIITGALSSPPATLEGLQLRGGNGIVGGAVYCYRSTLVLRNCLIIKNMANNGAGVYCNDSTVAATNCTFASNTAYNAGGGLCADSSSMVDVGSSIFWGNTAPVGADMAARPSSTITAQYCNASAGGVVAQSATANWSDGQGDAIGNMEADPLFYYAAALDFHLKSKHGRWSPSANGGAGDWVFDDVTSPCINAGDPTSDYGAEPQPNGCRVNMGAYGNTAEASKGRWIIPGDSDCNSRVDVLDLIFVRNRLGQDAATGDNWKADVNEDGRINVLDLIFARNRLGTSRP